MSNWRSDAVVIARGREINASTAVNDPVTNLIGCILETLNPRNNLGPPSGGPKLLLILVEPRGIEPLTS